MGVFYNQVGKFKHLDLRKEKSSSENFISQKWSQAMSYVCLFTVTSFLSMIYDAQYVMSEHL